MRKEAAKLKEEGIDSRQVEIELGDSSAQADGKATEAELDRFHLKVEQQASMPVYPGTFNEYNTKVIQFGFISMFSAAYPVAALCGFAINFWELRTDAMKTFNMRRPRCVEISMRA